MVRHADRVMQNSTYLDIADLILYSCMCKAELRVILNTTSQLVLNSARPYLEGILPRNLRLPLPMGTDRQWTVALTRADYVPSDDVAGMNHWLPCWPAGMLTIAEEKTRIAGVANDRRLLLLARVAQAGSEAEERSAEEALELLYMRTDALQDLVEQMTEELSLLPREVAADGSCGCWTLMALQKGSPFLGACKHEESVPEMRQLRESIAVEEAACSMLLIRSTRLAVPVRGPGSCRHAG